MQPPYVVKARYGISGDFVGRADFQCGVYVAYAMGESQIIKELKSDEIDIAWLNTTREREKDLLPVLLPVRLPIIKG